MNRIDFLINEISGKDVLDIGSNDMDNSNFLYNKMKKHAKKITGIDIKTGYNFETYRLKKKFEVLVAGEVIEHLDNPGLFLDNCIRHLGTMGKLIITTPNVLSLERIFKHVLTGSVNQDVFRNNPEEHTLYFTKDVIERLLFRHGFKIERFFYVNHEIHDPSFSKSNRPFIAKVVYKIKMAFKNIRPHFRDTMFILAAKV